MTMPMDLNLPLGGAFGRLIVVVLMPVVGGCGTGDGNRTPGEPGPPCIRVHGGECLVPEKFAESAAELAEAYRGEDDFADRWELAHIKADQAYGDLRLLQGPAAEPGAGVTLGFLDSGIVTDHPAFAGKTVTQDWVEEPAAGSSPLHGTAVASVAAGARSSAPRAVHGVAWGADIAMFTLNVGSGPPLYAPISPEEMAAGDAGMAGWFEHALALRDGDRKVDILNLSIGFAGLMKATGPRRAYGVGRAGDHEAALPRPVVEHGTGGAAVRDGGQERLLRGLDPVRAEGHGPRGRDLAGGRAGGAGGRQGGPGRGSHPVDGSRSRDGLRRRVPALARAAPSDGPGPAGSAVLVPSGQLHGGCQRAVGDGAAAGIPGAGPADHERRSELMGPDGTGRGERPRRAAGSAGAEDDGAAGSLHAAWLDVPVELRGSHMALAEGAAQATLAGRSGLSAAAFTTQGIPGQAPALGASLSWRRAGSPVGLRAGWIGEPKTLLGSVGRGAFGALAADTSFVGVDAGTDVGGWRLAARAELGLVAPRVGDGLVSRVSPLATSTFALQAVRGLAGAAALRFSVSQPLRVEHGRASLAVPAGRTRTGAVVYDVVGAGLVPSARQMDFAGEWLRPLPRGELRLGAVYSHRPGHRGDAQPELTFLGGWRREF